MRNVSSLRKKIVGAKNKNFGCQKMPNTLTTLDNIKNLQMSYKESTEKAFKI